MNSLKSLPRKPASSVLSPAQVAEPQRAPKEFTARNPKTAMRTAMVAYAFYEGNARIQQYAKALVGQGATVDVFCLQREGEPKFQVLDGVNVYGVQARQVNEKSQFTYLQRILRFLAKSSFVLAKKHFAERYQVIHVHSVPDFLVFGSFLPRLTGARVILDIHDILPEFYASKFGAKPTSFLFKMLVGVEKLSSAFSDHVIIANGIWRDRLIGRSVRADRCTAICNYPDPEVFHTFPVSRDNKKFVIIYPGSLNWHQGLDVAVRAFAKVAQEIPEAEFVIHGEGPMKPDLVALAAKLGLQDRVIFKDMLPLRQVAQVMATADLAVVPKRASSSFGNEAASTKILEFMSVGVPLIVSRTKIDTYYHSDATVKFFESENEDDLAQCILALRRQPELGRTQVANALKYARDNSWDVKKDQYLRLVDSLVYGAS